MAWIVSQQCSRISPGLMDRILKHFSKSGWRHHHCGRKLVSKMYYPLYVKKLPSSEEHNLCKSHKLLMYRDIIHQIHPGGYCLLPLGQRVLDKLVKLIDQEMSAIGAQKISMVTQQPKSLWTTTGRWDDIGKELFKMKDRHGKNYCLGPTHEEVITSFIARKGQRISHKKLPIKLYQITRKFRDEMAPKHGLLRGREFEMKDLYTFDATEEQAKVTYESVCKAYENIFDRLQVPFIKAEGSTGKIGGSMSHEFHLEADIGQDIVMICDKCGYSANKELPDAENRKEICQEASCAVQEKTCIEIGHSFLLGTKYSESFKCMYEENDKNKLLEMGCYGLGVSRFLQGCVEVLSSSVNIRWPKLIAPYQICIIPEKLDRRLKLLMKTHLSCSLVIINTEVPHVHHSSLLVPDFMTVHLQPDGRFLELACSLSDQLSENAALSDEIVVDDQDKNVGVRIQGAKALGYPYIITVKDKALSDPSVFEVIDVYEEKSMFLSVEQIIDFTKTIQTI